MKDKFDLELEISNISTLRFPLDTLAQRLLDGEIGIHEASVILSGIAAMADLYSDSLHSTMCEALGMDDKKNHKPTQNEEYAKAPHPENAPYDYGIE